MKKSKLAVGISAALGSFIIGGVNAEGESSPDALLIEEVIITGTRLINSNAINEKRNSIQVRDSIGEDEVGGLAASNAAELLAKVPGLNSYEDLSGQGSGGSTGPEPQLVSVRGIQPALNLVLLDGMSLAVSAFQDRAQRMDIFPVNISGRTDVVKSFTSDLDGGAIGGQIDFVTRRGIDFQEPLISFTAEIGQAEEDDGVEDVGESSRFEALYVGQLTDTIGIAASASYNQREVAKQSQLTRGRSRSIDFPGVDDVRVVREHRILNESAESERKGFSIKLDYAPNEDVYTWVTAAYSNVDQTINHHKTDVRIPSSATGLSLDPGGKTGTLRIDDGAVSFGTGRSAFSEVGEFVNEADLTVFQAGLEMGLNDDLTLLLKGSYSEATNSRESEYFLFMRAGGVTDVAFNDSNIKEPLLEVVSPDPDSYFDTSQYSLLYRNLLPEMADEDLLDVAPSISFNAGEDDEGWGANVGLRYKKTDRKYDFSFRTQFDLRNRAEEGSGFVLEDVFAGNSAGLSPPGSGSGFPGFYADIDTAHSLILPLVNDPARFELESKDSNEFGSDFEIEEIVQSAFIQGIYQSERLQAVFGVRYEETSTDGSGFREMEGVYRPVSSSGDYDFLLPSLLVNYNVREDLKLRFSASETVGRPAFPQIAPTGEEVSLGLQNTLERSNPELDPRHSRNLDLGLEWYFKSDSIASIGIFSKRIDDEILTETINNVVIGGILFDSVTEPVNATDSTINGVELVLVTYFDFLSGPFNNLGISFNALYLDAEFEAGGDRGTVDYLLFQPDRITNFSLLYTDERFDASLSWNYTGRLPTVFNPSNSDGDRFLDDRDTLNAKFLYYVNENLQVFVNGTNLTSEDTREFTGEGFLYHNRELGRTINLGLTYAF